MNKKSSAKEAVEIWKKKWLNFRLGKWKDEGVVEAGWMGVWLHDP
jgi:hypothetical protein